MGETRRKLPRRRLAEHAARALAAALLAATGTVPAFANDTSATLAAGGLQFVRSDRIAMLSEDLFLSEAQVRVHYVFKNEGKQDVTTLIAFPMPDITVTESPISIPDETAPENFLDFKTVVDGKPVETKVEQKAFALDIDRTALLQTYKVPLAPQLAETQKALDAIPQAQWEDLVSVGLAAVEEYDDGKGMQRHLAPRWTVKTTYYWMQTFPAGRELVVDHTYRPSVGGSAGTLVGMTAGTDPWLAKAIRQTQQTYCIDKDFLGAVGRAVKTAGNVTSAPFGEARLSYILTTGANWSGPIGSFTLTVDKGAAQNLVSFCGTGVKKTGPTTFQMTAKDFYPQEDLSILILKPYPRP